MRICFYLVAGVLLGAPAIMASGAADGHPHLHHGLHAVHFARPGVSVPLANQVAPAGTLKSEDRGSSQAENAVAEGSRNNGRPGRPGTAKIGIVGTSGGVGDANTRIPAKEIVPHGKFLGWAQHEFGWTPRHVQNHLMLAANAKRVSHLAPGASLRMALAAIKHSSQTDELKVVDTLADGASLKVQQTGQRIHLIGEIEEGSVDCDQLLLEVIRITASLGAPKARWKARHKGGAAPALRQTSIV